MYSFLLSVPLGVLQTDFELVVTVASVSTRDGITLRPQRHPAQHQTRRKHAVPPAGLQNDGLQRWQRPRARTGAREEDLPVGEEPVGQVGEEVHPGQRRKETAWRGGKEHWQQKQRCGAVPGLQRPSAATWPWQLQRHLFACLWRVPWVQPRLRAKRRRREPLRHSAPNPSCLRRIPIKPPGHQPAPGSTPASSQSLGPTDRGVEGIAGGSRRTQLQ